MTARYALTCIEPTTTGFKRWEECRAVNESKWNYCRKQGLRSCS